MKFLTRFTPILAGVGACAIVAVIGVMLAMNDESGSSAKLVAIAALVVGGVVFQVVKNKMDKGGPQKS